MYWRWRQRTSSGYGVWFITESDAETISELEEYLDDARSLSTWSEHYRGIEGKKLKIVPLDYISKQIEDADETIEHLQKKINEYVAIIKKHYVNTDVAQITIKGTEESGNTVVLKFVVPWVNSKDIIEEVKADFNYDKHWGIKRTITRKRFAPGKIQIRPEGCHSRHEILQTMRSIEFKRDK